jgi:uncharacterized protein (TIGR02231 family)
VSILLADVKEAGRIELVISYLVGNASWTPAYDIRVVKKKMILIYYGVIKENTGENWDEVQAVLSTATPRIGGQVPTIGQVKIGLIPHRRRCAEGAGLLIPFKAMSPPIDMYGTHVPQLKLTTEKAQSGIKRDIRTTMKVVQDSVSTSFRVPRLTTIPSDNADHRLTIGQIGLDPTFKHLSVPCKVASACLTARVINTSEYELLSGPTSFYSGNSFVCKGRMESVGPRGEFMCSLGVDSNVKIV